VTLMPKATAVWLIDNTTLTFEQIATFCNLHIIEVQAIADGDVSSLKGFDPIISGQLTLEEIERCQNDPASRLVARPQSTAEELLGKKKKKYVAVSKRQDRPDAIAWFVRYYPQIPDGAICDILGTTKKTVHAVRSKTHRYSSIIKPKNPVILGICTQNELDLLVKKFGQVNTDAE